MTNIILISAIILMPALYVQAQDTKLVQADRLFADRDKVESLKQAAKMIEQMVAQDATSFDAQWRLAKFRYYLSEREQTESAKLNILQSGIDAAKKAVALNADRVEGHFWLAANVGGYAEVRGGINALGLVKTVRKEFQAALAIDPAYENGAIYLALGQIDLEMPGIFGGNDKRGLQRFEQGLKIASTNAELKLALAEVYLKKEKKEEARKLLESVLGESDPARTASEMADLRNKARIVLNKTR